jgi:hyperosmotically inducible protein
VVLTVRSARQRVGSAVAAGVSLVAALALAAVVVRSGGIESDLEQRARAALAERGMAGLEVDVRGRDAVLTGIVASEADRRAAVEAVARVRGVRAVRDDLWVSGAAPAATPEAAPAMMAAEAAKATRSARGGG